MRVAVASQEVSFRRPVGRPLLPTGRPACLTRREREILVLLTQGLTNAAIAERLCVTPSLVSNYLTRIYVKLEVSSRIKAILYVLERGLPPGESPD